MSSEPRKCLRCPHHPSSPLHPHDLYIGHSYSLFLPPTCTHSAIQRLDHTPFPPTTNSQTPNSPDHKKTHTYAHCSRCNLILDYDVWGCGCFGLAGRGGGIHDVERILYTPGACTHCAERGREPETECETERCVRCMEIRSDGMCGTRVYG